jgi:hypothetical protein
MANRRTPLSFFISIVLHISAVALLFLFLHSSQLPRLFQRSVLIEIADAPKSLSTGKGNLGSKSRSARTSNSFQLKDLGVKYGWQVPTAEKSNPGGAASESDHGSANDVDIVKEGKESPLFKYVRDQVENNLYYPAELKQKFIEGTVSGVVVFSKGEFIEEQTRLQSSSSYLKVAVMRALRQAFRDSLPEKYWKLAADSEGRLEVQSQFIFSIVEHDEDEKAETLQAVSGRTVAFYRTYVHSALQWKLGPLSGLGPLVSLDVLWIPEKIAGLFSKKAEIDPLDSYRDDPAW